MGKERERKVGKGKVGGRKVRNEMDERGNMVGKSVKQLMSIDYSSDHLYWKEMLIHVILFYLWRYHHETLDYF